MHCVLGPEVQTPQIVPGLPRYISIIGRYLIVIRTERHGTTLHFNAKADNSYHNNQS